MKPIFRLSFLAFLPLLAPLAHAQVTIDWADVDKTGSNLNQIATRDFSVLQNKPTTLAGYGITDGLTSATAASTYVALGGSYADPAWITSLAKSKVGLGSVENTALSTWAGTTNVTTLGTIATGTWHGTVIGPAYLGTGTRDGTKFLRDDGTYQPAPGVTGPGSSTDYALALWNSTAGATLRNSTLLSNSSGQFGIGTAPSYPLHLVATSTATGSTNAYGAYIGWTHTANSTSSGAFSALNVINAAGGTGQAVEEVAVNGILNWSNTNANSRGTAVEGHFQTMAGSGANAAVLAGFRTSLDNNGGGTVAAEYGLWVPQVDVANGSVVSYLAGVQIEDLNTDPVHKPSVYGFRANGQTMRNFFAGYTGIGNQEAGQTTAALAVGQDNASALNTGSSGTAIQVRIAPAYNQTATAGAANLLIAPTGTLGSGPHYNIEAKNTAGADTFTLTAAGTASAVVLKATGDGIASSTTTGAAVITGGLGVSRKGYFGDTVVISGGNTATSTSTGDLVTTGGIGIGGAGYFGAGLNVNGDITGPAASNFTVAAGGAGRALILTPGSGADLKMTGVVYITPASNTGTALTFTKSAAASSTRMWDMQVVSDTSPDFVLQNLALSAAAVTVASADSKVTFAGVVKFPSFIVSGLPSASTAGAGATALATDLTSITSGGTAAGTGSLKHLVVSDGTNWLVL